MDFIKSTYTTEEIDDLAKEVAVLKVKKKKTNEELSNIEQKLAEKTDMLIEALQETGKSKWSIPGFNLSVAEKVFPKMEKDHESVASLMHWLASKGKDFYLSHVSVNAQTLRRLLKEEREVNPEAEIPGVNSEYKKKSIQMRKG